VGPSAERHSAVRPGGRPEPEQQVRAPTLVGARSVRVVGLALALGVAPPLVDGAVAARTATGSFGVVQAGTVHATATTSGIPGGERIVLEGRAGGGRSGIRARSVVRRGSAKLQWRYPRRTQALHLRVRVVRGTGSRTRTLAASPWRVLRLGGLRHARRLAPIAQGTVISAPTPGRHGDLVLAGAPSVGTGDVVALPSRPATPDGLLVRVVGVRAADGRTVARVVPARLPDVLPVADLSVVVRATDPPALSGRGRVGALRATPSCDNPFGATIAGRASLSAGLRLEAAWRASTSLERPNVTADIRSDVRAAVDAGIVVSGGGSCAFGSRALFAAPIVLSRTATSIGPVPIVVTVDGQAVLSGATSTLGKVAAAARGGVRAQVHTVYDGLRATQRGRLTSRLRPHDMAVAASGGAQVGVTPNVELRVNGLAGPSLDFGSGTRTTADIGRTPGTPWWTSTAPDALGASFALQALRPDLQEPREELQSHDAEIGHATSPPGGTSASPASTAPTALQDGVTAQVTWDSAAGVELHAWDAEGHHASIDAPRAIPGTTLSTGYVDGVPAARLTGGDPSRPLTIGLCLADGSEATAALDVRATDGGTVRHAVVLRGERAAAMAAVSPEGGPASQPSSGWCGLPSGDPVLLGQLTDGVLPTARPRVVLRPSGSGGDARTAPVRKTARVTSGTQGGR
jgi:hypothetical protein